MIRVKISILKAILLLSFCSLFTQSISAINLDDKREDIFDEIEKFDNVVYIKIGNGVCTGALINHRTVLTASHCLKDGEKAEIYLGNEITDTSIPIATSSFIKLPEERRYTSFTGASYDLALIALSEPLTSISPLTIDSTLPSLNTEVFISGFGLHGTGSVPDQDFDSKKRWGKNILNIIARENFLLSEPALTTTSDKIILGFYFDKGINSLESMISLGDSGSPLLIEADGSFNIVGVASWVSPDINSLVRGYGSSAGYASISENIDWINLNNPLRLVSSVDDGSWTEVSNWNELNFPNNFNPLDSNYNKENSRYYSVNISNSLFLSENVEIDDLNISNSGSLLLNNDSYLNILVSAYLQNGTIINNGTFVSPSLIINDGSYTNNNLSDLTNNFEMFNGELINNGTFKSSSIELKNVKTRGIGTFSSKKFVSEGLISPGNNPDDIGTLTFESILESKGEIQIDLNNLGNNDSLISNKFIIGGTLSLNPISTFFSGNSKFTLMNFTEMEGKEFNNVKVLKDNFGRLNKKLFYGKNKIDLTLLNPNYESIGTSNKSKVIGSYIDSFSGSTSSNFQSVLNQLNYVESDNELSDLLEDFIPTTNYSYFIDRINSLSNNSKRGIFISESAYDYINKGAVHDSEIRRLDLNYFGINIAYFKMESEFKHSLNTASSDSNAIQIAYKIPISFLDINLSLINQDIDILSTRMLEIKSSDFQATHNRSLEIQKQTIAFGKKFSTHFFNINAGFKYSNMNLETPQFSENFNQVVNDHLIKDASIDFPTVYANLSRQLDIGLNKFKFGILVEKSNFDEQSLVMKSKLDVSNELLTSQDSLKLSNKPLVRLHISNTYKETFFGGLSYSKRDESEMIEFSIGYKL
jgi:hypothetical protein